MPHTLPAGVTGAYTIELRFAPRSGAAPDAVATPRDLPDFFTALQEQLGLKLVPQKSKVPACWSSTISNGRARINDFEPAARERQVSVGDPVRLPTEDSLRAS